MTSKELRYDFTTIALHWFVTLSVALLWVMGQTADWLPDHGAANKAVWSVHVALGFVLAIALIWRVAWRASRGTRLPPANTGVLHLLAKGVHYLLYALLIVVVGLGVVNAFVRGYTLFDAFSLPQIGDKSLRRPITHWHGLAANVLLGLACLHALVGLAHHYILREPVLRRMMPTRVSS